MTTETLSRPTPTIAHSGRWVNCYLSVAGELLECFYCGAILRFAVGTTFFSHCVDYPSEQAAREAEARNSAELHASGQALIDVYLGPMPKL